MKTLPWGLFMNFHTDTPNRYLPLEVPEGPAAATSIQNSPSRSLTQKGFSL